MEAERLKEAQRNLTLLGNFIGKIQRIVLYDLLKGEEDEFFADKLAEISKIVAEMPKVYETDGIPKAEKTVWLHYFGAAFDAWIFEKDSVGHEPQLQAFGIVKFYGNDPEMGYVNIQELLKNGAEIDLHFKPTTWAEIEKTLN